MYIVKLVLNKELYEARNIKSLKKTKFLLFPKTIFHFVLSAKFMTKYSSFFNCQFDITKQINF